VHLFDIWPAVSSGKIRDLSVWRMVTLNTQYIVIVLKVLLMKQSIMDCQPLCVHVHKTQEKIAAQCSLSVAAQSKFHVGALLLSRTL